MNKLLTLSVIVLGHSAFASDYQVYKVKKGDTLSELLGPRSTESLYGEDKLVEKSLTINRLDEKKAKKLRVGSYLILPKKEVIITDSTSTSQAATSRDGILSSKISHHQNIEVGVEFSKKAQQLENGKNIIINENYQANIKVVGNQVGSPTVGASISTSNGVTFEDDSSRLVELRPNYELQTSYNFLENNRINIGALANLSEESSVTYNDSEVEVRRDQYMWIGATAATTLYYKKFELNLSGDLKQKVSAYSITNSEDLNLTRAQFTAKINLTKDYYLTTSYKTEIGDRSGSALGLGFIYEL
ncbi:MAG: hypothetical protein ACJAS4_001462 [Bacteriovoracaceae bacterium]|jgi:hypothetical protein